jgi:hypothetical protein
MGWSNDTLNSLYVYSATTGALILSVDETGFEFIADGNDATIDEFGIGLAKDPFDGSYVQIATFTDGTVIFLQPQFSTIPGATYTIPASLLADENVITPGTQAQGYLALRSPSINGKTRGEIIITGESNTSGFLPEIQLNAQSLYGVNKNMIGAGTVDTYPGLFNTNFTTVRTIFDFCRPNAVGVMSASRAYEVEFNFSMSATVTSSVANLQIYAANSSSSLTGATLLYDAGNFGGTFVQYSLKWTFDGVPGKYIVISGLRTTGTGTFTGFANYRKLQDVCNAF